MPPCFISSINLKYITPHRYAHLPHPAGPAKTATPPQPSAAPPVQEHRKLAATPPDRPVPSPHESQQVMMRKSVLVLCSAVLQAVRWFPARGVSTKHLDHPDLQLESANLAHHSRYALWH